MGEFPGNEIPDMNLVISKTTKILDNDNDLLIYNIIFLKNN